MPTCIIEDSEFTKLPTNDKLKNKRPSVYPPREVLRTHSSKLGYDFLTALASITSTSKMDSQFPTYCRFLLYSSLLVVSFLQHTQRLDQNIDIFIAPNLTDNPILS